ncbi:MAG: DUF2946 family protein [Rhizobacter sp.]|nr:DUF2946 family protein [Rhizobacter sp.]
MDALRPRPSIPRRFTWLLWLALLLPMAQVAANWHAFSHTGRETSSDTRGEPNGKQAPHFSHCDLCLTAAAVTGGALAAAPTVLPIPALRHQAPQSVFASVWLALTALAYLSRAPPLAPH